MAEHEDITEEDAQFGKQALEKQQEADAMEVKGENPEAAPEGDGEDPRPRAGGKASDGAPPAA